MRKLPVLFVAIGALFCACSKHNAGTSYYFSFQSGAFSYSNTVDSQVLVQLSSQTGYALLILSSTRTQQQTDSAQAGLLDLATWDLDIVNNSPPVDDLAGTYTPDTSGTNVRRIVTNVSRFQIYTSNDPHHGQYWIVPGLPFNITVTQWTSSWFAGTFEGMILQTNSTTNVTDTATITNGKFRLPHN